MSLFRETLRLCSSDKERAEDLLTEIVAVVLQNSHDLALAWLETIGVPVENDAQIVSIGTQERLAALPGHATDSRVDLVIRLAAGDGRHIIFIEAKVGSKENVSAPAPTANSDDAETNKPQRQLQTYAELLVQLCQKNNARGSLVFITRDYQPVVPPPGAGLAFSFHASRWFRFYYLLKSGKNSDGLVRELMLFMKEKGMSIGNQFRSVDLVALDHFLGAKLLMDETLNEMTPRWRKILGKGGRIHRAWGLLRMRGGQYMIQTKFSGFEVLLGYWLPYEDPDVGVSVGILISCQPSGEHHEALVSAFRAWSKEQAPKWGSQWMNDPKGPPVVARWEWLRALQTTDDHVAQVKAFFNVLLDDLQTFKIRFPELPWVPAESADDEE